MNNPYKTHYVVLLTEDGTKRHLRNFYYDIAEAEAEAHGSLGLNTVGGVVIASQVVDSQWNILSEFEY